MKRFLLPLFILTFSLPLMSQTHVVVSGMVTDEVNGNAIPDHEVYISSDSSGGFIYYNMVLTDNTGHYVDSIPINAPADSGILLISTYDCNFTWLSYPHYFGPGNYYPEQDFQICTDSTGGSCMANFIAYQDSLQNNTVTFVDQSSGNITQWYWEFGDGQSAYGQNQVHTYSTPGTYNVCLTVTGSDSLCFDTYCADVEVGYTQEPCQAQFTYYMDSTWASQPVYFIDLSTGDLTDWLWDFGDGSPTSSEQNPFHIFPEPGTYYVCLTVYGFYAGAQCESTWCQEVVVTNYVGCNSYFTFQKTGLDVTFNGFMVYGQPATYSWDFGDGQTGGGQTVSHQYSASGIYFVSLTTVTQDSSNCTYSSGQSITVGDSTQWNQVYGQVFAGSFPIELGSVMIFSLDTNQNYFPFIDVCPVDSFGIYYFSMVPLGNYYIQAFPILPAGYLPTYYGDVLNWEEATLITLGEANNPYNINLLPAESYVPGIGAIHGQINSGEMKSGMVDKITMILMNEAGQAISFQSVDMEGGFDFPELDYGTYYLYPELAGCQGENIKVELTPEQAEADVVLTFTGNHILGLDETNPTMYAGVVYPNPVRDQAQISVNLSESSRLHIELVGLTGQCLYSRTDQLGSGATTITIPVHQFREGMYMLRMFTDNGLNINRKFMIYR